MVGRILRLTGAGPQSRVLSLGCGIGDTELLLAPRVAEVAGVDLSPAAVRQARADAERLGIRNARFEQGTTAAGIFDAVVAIFFLHHLPDGDLAALPAQLWNLLAVGGVFYSLDPSRNRLSGRVGRAGGPPAHEEIPDTRTSASSIRSRQRNCSAGPGSKTRVEMYDFGSSPLAGLFPGWGAGYRAARRLDDWILRAGALRRLGSNFELIARKPR